MVKNDDYNKQIKELDTYFKRLVNATNRKTIWHTINIMLLIIGGRTAFYDDYEKGGFIGLPIKYKNIMIEIFDKYRIGILFDKGRFFAWDSKRVTIPTYSNWTHKETGELLGFPCSLKSLKIDSKGKLMSVKKGDKIYVASVEIENDFGTTYITGFSCTMTEKRKIIQWYKNLVPYLEHISNFFKKFDYKLNIETSDKAFGF